MPKASPERALRRLRSDWDALAESDAMHAVLSDPTRDEGRWEADDFYATGEIGVAAFFEEFERQGIDFPRGRALDFGCGLGRLTIPLAHRFEHAVGVDISAEMITRARQGDVPPNCEFLVNQDPELSVLGNTQFDFVLSVLVLQHMRPELATLYLDALCRRVAPGGALFVQIPYDYARVPPGAPTSGARAALRRAMPSALVHLRRRMQMRANERRLRRAGLPVFELHRVRLRTIERVLESNGLRVVNCVKDDAATAAPLVSAWYVARRPE